MTPPAASIDPPRPAPTVSPGDNVPRYTSYPTAPHFHPGVDAVTVRGWMDALEGDDEISLYLHIPYCDRLCWFCACHTKQTRHYAPVATFLRSFHKEIETVGGLVSGRGRVRAVHFGGGSPTMLKPDDILTLGKALRDQFDFLDDASLSVEIDPNDMDEGRLDAFAAIGMTRASLGVQDFDPKVQKAINREQSFALTKSIVDAVRARGVSSRPCTLSHARPFSMVGSVAATVAQALTLAPDRLALFGYAHVPWFKTHQRLIDVAQLPGVSERLEQAQAAEDVLTAAGYEAVGLDHFALPGDSLAVAARTHRLRRNFQGYTVDEADALIGVGASSIGRLPQGFAQNAPDMGGYARAIESGRFAIAKGIALSEDDRARGRIIEQLMCNFVANGDELDDEAFDAALETLGPLVVEGFVRIEDRSITVAHAGRPFVRLAAAAFDAYLAHGKARHSLAV